MTRFRWFAVAGLVAFLAGIAGQARAQSKDDGYATVNGFAVHGYAKGVEIGYEWYPDRGKAEAAKAQMERVETTTGKYYDRVDITPEQRRVYVGTPPTPLQDRLNKARESFDLLKEAYEKIHDAKEAVDKARKFIKDGLTAEERKLGDTLKEYSDRVKDAYDRVSKLKGYMTSMTGNLSQKQFNDVNKMIDNLNSYNGVLQKYQGSGYGGKLASVPKMPRVAPSDLKAKLPSPIANSVPPRPETPRAMPPAPPVTPDLPRALTVAGTTFSGSEDLGGYGRLSFAFRSGGSATMYDTDGAQPGSWSQSGNQVTLRFYSGSVVYQGTLTGRTIAGTADNGRTTWQWSVAAP